MCRAPETFNLLTKFCTQMQFGNTLLMLLLLLKSTNRIFLLNREAFNLWFIIIYNILVLLKRNSKSAKWQTNVSLFCQQIVKIFCTIYTGGSPHILRDFFCWIYAAENWSVFWNLHLRLKSFLVFLNEKSLYESKYFVSIYSAM